MRNAFVHGSYINRLSGEIEDRIQYTAEDLKSVAGPIPIPVGTVVTVLVTLLESLLKVVSVLVACNIGLISVAARAIDVINAPIHSATVLSVYLPLTIPLTVAVVNSLSQQFGSP